MKIIEKILKEEEISEVILFELEILNLFRKEGISIDFLDILVHQFRVVLVQVNFLLGLGARLILSVFLGECSLPH